MKPFDRTFVCESEWNLELDEALGGQRYALSIHERLRYRFSATRGHPHRLTLELRRASLYFDAFGILLPGDRWLFTDEFELTTRDLDRSRCGGTLDTRTGLVSLTTSLRVRPKRFPLLWEFGLETPLDVEIAEVGRMDLKRRRLVTEIAPFTLGAIPGVRLAGAKPRTVTGSCALTMGPFGFMCKVGTCTGTCTLEEQQGGAWRSVPSPVPRTSPQAPLRCTCT